MTHSKTELFRLPNQRNRIDLMEPAELAIFHAMQEIEKIGADINLTDAQLLLSKAKDLVSDFIDLQPIEQPEQTVAYNVGTQWKPEEHKTAEEIANKHEVWKSDNQSQRIIKAIHDYHSQFSKEVSDEEIEKAFPIASSHQMDTESWNNRLKQQGAKWMRSQLVMPNK